MATATMTLARPTDQHATLSYIRPDSKMNRWYMAAGAEVSVGEYETRNIQVHDIRPDIDNYTLEKTGYQLYQHSSSVSLSTR